MTNAQQNGYSSSEARGQDHRLLRTRRTPEFDRGTETSFAVVDLFCGCGGMSLGAALAAHANKRPLEIRLAVDSDEDVLEIYRDNFARFVKGGLDEVERRILADRIEGLFDGELGAVPTATERRIKRLVGRVDLMFGGPPCQGNSDLNNHTRRQDLRNGLYTRMVRAAQVLRPKVVVIENVPAVVHDRLGVVETAKNHLVKAGYTVTGDVMVRMGSLGVPQTRKRHILLASRVAQVDALAIGEDLERRGRIKSSRTVRWAIEDLQKVSRGRGTSIFDRPGNPSKENRKRMDWLFDRNKRVLPDRLRPSCHRNGGHTYKSVYGRMAWDEPAQTVTTGFGSMGQGCYVHPSERRTVTPHEAARLQTFPDFFRFGSAIHRSVLARAIGNAVPPFAMSRITSLVVKGLAGRGGIETTLDIELSL